MSALPNTTPVETLLNESRLKQLNTASLLVQAGKALQDGDQQRAALLFGAAIVAPKYSGASYLIQGALTANDLRKKL